ncbi:MAG: C_GCAxxG_C_C family protein [Chloroflexi bacterium]|nr:C_GCAxxG_C_C family protein [Chloroflexota bacterium]
MQSMERIDRAKEKAHRYERDYGGCAQCVLGALQEEFGIGNKDSFKAASVLSGGIARQGETCGAIVGALSALGLEMGRASIEDTGANKAAMDAAVRVSARFREELKKRFGLKKDLRDNLCWHIQEMIYGRHFDLANKAEYQAFVDAGGHSDSGCPAVCGLAAQVAAEEIEKLREKPDKG